MGFTYGIFMFCAMLFMKIIHNQSTIQEITIQAFIWLGVGLFYGVTMWFFSWEKK
jgi:hypothetical protein